MKKRKPGRPKKAKVRNVAGAMTNRWHAMPMFIRDESSYELAVDTAERCGGGRRVVRK